jgi:hypothetical protein
MKLTPAMKHEWENLEKAYDYGSNDKRLSLAAFKHIWLVARNEQVALESQQAGREQS